MMTLQELQQFWVEYEMTQFALFALAYITLMTAIKAKKAGK